MKKVLIITYYYPPSGGSGVQRWMYFSKYLSRFGFEPVVLTVDPARASYKFIDESLMEKVRDVEVHRTDTLEPISLYAKLQGGDKRKNIPQGFSGESNPSLFQKLSRFIRGNIFLPDARRGWNKFAFPEAVRLIEEKKISLVITTGPPHSTHLIGLKLKNKLAINWIADLRDPWTELYYNRMLYRTSLADSIDVRMQRRVLETADMVLTIGPGMNDLMKSKVQDSAQSKFHYIYNGYDEELFEGIASTNNPDHFVICHTGILSENQPITSFLEGMKLFFTRFPDALPKCKMKFVGNVSPLILQEVNSVFAKENVILVPYVPHRESVAHMMESALLLNSFALSEESKILVSGKLMEYLASGKPILGLGNPEGDAAKLLKGMEYASVFDRSDISGISSFIENIYIHWLNKKNFEPADIKQYSRLESTRLLATYLQSI